MDARIPQGGVPVARPAAGRAAAPATRRGPQRPAAGAAGPEAEAGTGAGARRLRPDTPPGAAALMGAALGRPVLPPPLELMRALDAALAHAPLADRAVPGLGRLVSAVIDDERFKLGRMLDLGRQ